MPLLPAERLEPVHNTNCNHRRYLWVFDSSKANQHRKAQEYGPGTKDRVSQLYLLTFSTDRVFGHLIVWKRGRTGGLKACEGYCGRSL